MPSNHEERSTDVRYCPFCGEPVYAGTSDGTYECDHCHTRFSVITVE